jgi:hypothetical protein
MKGEATNDMPMEWPGAGILFFSAALLASGLAVAALRGPAPAGDVVILAEPAPPPVAPAPTEP